jgi:hypothetical protein
MLSVICYRLSGRFAGALRGLSEPLRGVICYLLSVICCLLSVVCCLLFGFQFFLITING